MLQNEGQIQVITSATITYFSLIILNMIFRGSLRLTVAIWYFFLLTIPLTEIIYVFSFIGIEG